MTDTSKIASSLRSAIDCFERDREGAAIGPLRYAATLFADPNGMGAAQVAVRAAIKDYERGNDRSALGWSRSALERLAGDQPPSHG